MIYRKVFLQSPQRLIIEGSPYSQEFIRGTRHESAMREVAYAVDAVTVRVPHGKRQSVVSIGSTLSFLVKVCGYHGGCAIRSDYIWESIGDYILNEVSLKYFDLLFFFI